MEELTPEKKRLMQMLKKEELSDEEKIAQWRDSAFEVALEKLQETQGNTEMVLQIGEAFGRGLFAQRLKEKTPNWTMKTWVKETEKDIFKPLGEEFGFTKISPDAATIFMNRNPLKSFSQESTVASLFHYGLIRGLFLSAFPQGELLLNEEKAASQPELIFKTHASMKDRFERERVKRVFTLSKNTNGA